MTDTNIGRLIANRYQIQDLIGTGAMGWVYLANDIVLGVPVALKFLALSIQNPKMRLHERFEREAKTSAILSQKSIHIVRVMDYGVDDSGTPFYIMEYLQGKSLSDIVHPEPLALPRFLSMARQICLGLHSAHQGIPVDNTICPIIHRDIKPSNVLVMPDPSFGELIKILDFGIAKLLQSDSSKTNYYLGTLAYSAPEQMEGKELDPRSDIYSLGVMMFEMLTGKMPIHPTTDSFGGWYKAHHFQAPRPFAVCNPGSKIPQDVEDLVIKCLAKIRDDRPQSVNEILQAIISFEQRYGGMAVLAQPPLQVTASPNQVTIPESKPVEPMPPVDDFCRGTSWPQDKPIADIVFPYPIRIDHDLMAALWVMLPQQEIQKRMQCTRYNQFLFVNSPRPMMLWITVLYHRQYGAKWLPYYLDLKTRQGQQLTRLLAEKGSYRMLLFMRENPQHARACLSLNISSAQRELFQQWLLNSQTSLSNVDPQLSKDLLKREFEKVKPQIIKKLEAVYTNSTLDLSG